MAHRIVRYGACAVRRLNKHHARGSGMLFPVPHLPGGLDRNLRSDRRRALTLAEELPAPSRVEGPDIAVFTSGNPPRPYAGW